MGFRDWWRKHSIFGAFIIGASIGLVFYFASFFFEDSNLSVFFNFFVFIPFCKLTQSEGEGCAIAYLFVGWVFIILLYGGLTAICWKIFQKLKRI
ncbi:MAG TPA: hypothetical protein VJB08_03335 [Candidatus Nanoarchaeia archaeon]|nr:hypothetical protein [Candidatus Nanoarchaeia archaeon]HLD42996.1 hypothetical protein [Candidatus Nanoarchaeia archaeon]